MRCTLAIEVWLSHFEIRYLAFRVELDDSMPDFKGRWSYDSISTNLTFDLAEDTLKRIYDRRSPPHASPATQFLYLNYDMFCILIYMIKRIGFEVELKTV